MARRKGKIAPRSADQYGSIPPEMACTLADLLGGEFEAFKLSLEEPSPVSIRINTQKIAAPLLDPVPWCSSGYYLQERPSFTFDPFFHAGAYYVQEASSMFLEQALRTSGILDRDILALDLCAAPGGKTTHLRSLLTEGSLLVANEVDRKRQAALKENLWKWGLGNVIITGSEAADLHALPEYFDLILIDAPCSGEGMMRKDPFAREQWSPKLVRRCALIQQEIVEHAWNALAPGGIMIYSTCTWEPAENEDRIHQLIDLGAIPIEIPIKPEWNIVTGGSQFPVFRFYPHRVQGEGLFLGMLKKPGELATRINSDRDRSDRSASIPFIEDPDRYHSTEMNEVHYVVDDNWAEVTASITKVLRTLAPGIPVSEKKGSGSTPHPALALNTSIKKISFPIIDLNGDQAIAFLKGATLPAKAERGISLASFNGLPLGWLLGVGDRWNNRWPDQWRIRSHSSIASPVIWPAR